MSGILTGSELRARVARMIGAGTDRDDEINENLELALEWCTTQHTFSELDTSWTYTTKANGESILFSQLKSSNGSTVDLERIFLAVIEDGLSSRPLIRSSYEELRALHPLPSAESTLKPTHYYIQSDTLYLYPIPDSAYTLRLRVRTKATPLDDSWPCVISKLDVCISAYAAYLCYLEEGEHLLASEQLKHASLALASTIVWDGRRSVLGTSHVLERFPSTEGDEENVPGEKVLNIRKTS